MIIILVALLEYLVSVRIYKSMKHIFNTLYIAILFSQSRGHTLLIVQN